MREIGQREREGGREERERNGQIGEVSRGVEARKSGQTPKSQV